MNTNEIADAIKADAAADAEEAVAVKAAAKPRRSRKAKETGIDWSKEPKGLGEGATDFDPATGKVTPLEETGEVKPPRSAKEAAAIPAKVIPIRGRKAKAAAPVAEEAPAKKAAKPAKERRNETTHPDGESAVATLGCPTCSARKAVRCVRHDGEHTNHVHSARMKAWEAKGSPAGTLPAKAPKAPAKKAATKAAAPAPAKAARTRKAAK